MEAVKELVRNIVAIVMLTAFLDMILPSGTMRPYVKMVMGLFILVTLLNPVLSLILHNREFEVFAWQQSGPTEYGSLRQQDSERLLSANRKIFMEDYARRLEIQMESLIELVEEVEVDIRVELQDTGNTYSPEGIKSVVVTITDREEEKPGKSNELVTPVKIRLNTPVDLAPNGLSPNDSELPPAKKNLSDDELKMEKEIKKVLCQHFGLQSRQVRVVFS